MAKTQDSWSAFEKRIQDAKNTGDLDAIDQELFGRKAGAMTLAMKELKDIPTEQKKDRAKELNEAKGKLTGLLEEKRMQLGMPSADALKKEDAIDVTLDLPTEEHGHLHLIPEFIREIEEVFGRMGFDVAYGPEIDTEEYNFDLLNFPKDHSARDAQDIFYINRDAPADNRPLLRAHTSTVQIHYMKSHKPPFRAIFPGKVYRKDADATHSPMFHQFEGLMIGKDISLAHLKGVLTTAIQELIGRDAEFRFRTGYFPFVEPGLEVDVRWQGDEKDSREGKWLEILGCGMVHPNVLKNVGIDPNEWQGFAFGCGVERMLMIKHQIPDLRAFYEGDLRFLRQF